MKKTTDRHQAILELVRTRDANVEALCAALGVSEATIRRDLTALAKQKRVFGLVRFDESFAGFQQAGKSFVKLLGQRGSLLAVRTPDRAVQLPAGKRTFEGYRRGAGASWRRHRRRHGRRATRIPPAIPPDR